MTPEHFSRILQDRGAAGLIEVNGRSVRIPDLERLVIPPPYPTAVSRKPAITANA